MDEQTTFNRVIVRHAGGTTLIDGSPTLSEQERMAGLAAIAQSCLSEIVSIQRRGGWQAVHGKLGAAPPLRIQSAPPLHIKADGRNVEGDR